MEVVKAEFVKNKKLIIYTAVPVTSLILIYTNWNSIKGLRQRLLAYLADRGHGHNKGHGHSHNGHSHGHGHTDAKHAEMKEKLFKELKELKVSSVPGVKGQGPRILEIGVGSGSNFPWFPQPCIFIALDPNPYFSESVAENLAKHPGVKLEQQLRTGAEKMDEIGDNSVDAVVATMVFCQVKDVQQTFQEIRRVLVPGGKFFFMDHLPAKKGTPTRMLQDFLMFTGLARVIFNANLHRDTGKDITSSGFSSVTKEYADSNVFGVATK